MLHILYEDLNNGVSPIPLSYLLCYCSYKVIHICYQTLRNITFYFKSQLSFKAIKNKIKIFILPPFLILFIFLFRCKFLTYTYLLSLKNTHTHTHTQERERVFEISEYPVCFSEENIMLLQFRLISSEENTVSHINNFKELFS